MRRFFSKKRARKGTPPLPLAAAENATDHPHRALAKWHGLCRKRPASGETPTLRHRIRPDGLYLLFFSGAGVRDSRKSPRATEDKE